MLLSSEAWHKLFLYQIEKLEEVDRSFFRQLLNCHSKTAIEFYYSETGSIPIRIKISARRLMYWWHMLRVNKSELINRVYSAQKLSPVNGDWVNLLENDKKQFDITLEDSEVAVISEQKFKNLIKKKSLENTIKYLEKLQKKNSKSKKLIMSDMRVSNYLVDRRFSRNERQLLFQLRAKTVMVKENFPNAFYNNDMLCDLCKLFPCTQSHPLQCPKLKTKMVVDQSLHISDKFLYGNADQQLLYVKIFKQFWDLREEMLHEQTNVQTD